MSDIATDSTVQPPGARAASDVVDSRDPARALGAACLAVPPVAGITPQAARRDARARGRRRARADQPLPPHRRVGGLRIMEADGGAEGARFEVAAPTSSSSRWCLGHRPARTCALDKPRVHLALEGGAVTTGRTCSSASPRLAARNPPRTRRRRAVLDRQHPHQRRPRARHDRVRGIRHGSPNWAWACPSCPTCRCGWMSSCSPRCRPSSTATLLLNAHQALRRIAGETILDVSLKRSTSPWVAYLPIEPRFRLPSALLTTNLELSFSQPADGAPVLSLRGPLQVDKLVLQDREGAPSPPRTRWSSGSPTCSR